MMDTTYHAESDLKTWPRIFNLGVNVALLLIACYLRHLWNHRTITSAQCMWLAWPVVVAWMFTCWNDQRLRIKSGSER